MAELKVGDVVKLKSGGPVMTVSRVAEESRLYDCQWFDGTELRTGRFAPDSLVKQDKGATANPGVDKTGMRTVEQRMREMLADDEGE